MAPITRPVPSAPKIGPFSFVLGVLAGAALMTFGYLALERQFRGPAPRVHPFGLDPGNRVPPGAAFDGRGGVKKLTPALREAYSAAEAAQEAGRGSAGAWAELAGADFPVLRARRLLAGLDWKPGDTLPADPEALSRLQRDLSAFPDHPLLLYLRGRLLQAAGRGADADSAYARAARRSPRFAYPRIRLGHSLAGAGRFAAAEREYRAAISLLAEDTLSYGGRGGGVPRLETPPYAELARLFHRRGHPDSASLVLECARQEGWRDSELDYLQALILEEQGGLRQADSLYRALAARHPDRTRYADALVTLGLKPLRGPAAAGSQASAVFAISLLEPLAQRFPRDAALRLALGQAYHHRGLYALAVASLDSALRLDSTLSEAVLLRAAAYRSWQEEPRVTAPDPATVRRPVAADTGIEAAQVILPGSMGLLGSYSVPWGAGPAEVRRAYPAKEFQQLAGGNLRETFSRDGLAHDYVLAFRKGELWGMYVTVTDTARLGGDLFGRILRLKSKISGEGRGTGEMACATGNAFQGVIWENDDTFEFLAQFKSRDNQLRLARLDRKWLPQNRRVCDLVRFLEPGAWK